MRDDRVEALLGEVFGEDRPTATVAELAHIERENVSASPEEKSAMLSKKKVRRAHGEKLKKYPLRTPQSEFKKFGEGMFFFFLFTKFFTAVLFVATLLALLPLGLNLAGGASDSYVFASPLVRTTLANSRVTGGAGRGRPGRCARTSTFRFRPRSCSTRCS